MYDLDSNLRSFEAYLKRIISTCCPSLSEPDVARLVKAMDKQGLGKAWGGNGSVERPLKGLEMGLLSDLLRSDAVPSSFYWAVPNEKCLTHRSLLRELDPFMPEHYCVNQSAGQDFRASHGTQGLQKCYDLQDCRQQQATRPQAVEEEGEFPNAVVFLTPEATKAALQMK